MGARVLYIGWDVGGWEGEHDGLAVLGWSHARSLQVLGKPTCERLRDVLNSEFSIDTMLQACGVPSQPKRVVVGIDAPLGWPREFSELVKPSRRDTEPYIPGDGGEMGNRLAYRYCDRAVRLCCGKKPLSATFDKLGGNATKAMVACRLLRKNSGAVVVPQEEDDGGSVVVCEAYPALWKQAARKEGDPLAPAAEALAGVQMPARGTDKADAVLCALTAACYDNQVRDLGRDLPELCMPHDESDGPGAEPGTDRLVRQEGWIYFPKATSRGWGALRG